MYLKYFWYICRHKWYVFLECCKHGLVWQGIVHDLSKFLPSEFFPYAKKFYGNKKNIFIERNFDIAWLYHQHRNKHHWEYWIQILGRVQEHPPYVVMGMPKKYAIEMYCDWVGAGKAIHGKNEVIAWYEKNKESILLHTNTQAILRKLLYKKIK